MNWRGTALWGFVATVVLTGLMSGSHGLGLTRMSLPYTRAIVNAAIGGQLDDVATVTHPVFGVAMPTSCPGVPSELLDPRSQWADKAAYDTAARDLAARFQKNFTKFGAIDPAIAGAGPKAE